MSKKNIFIWLGKMVMEGVDLFKRDQRESWVVLIFI